MTPLSDLIGSQIGIPSRLGRPAAEQTRDELEDLWRVTMGRGPGRLLADLDALKQVYDPVLTGRKLRDRIADLPERSSIAMSVPNQCRLRIDAVHALITPEGRVGLELLNSALASSPGDIIEIDEALGADSIGGLVNRYRDWGRHRIDGVVRLLNGEKQLQIQAIGGALTLLVNRSDQRDRAVIRVPTGRARDDIDAAFRAPAQAFSAVLSPSERRPEEKERLISGWTLHEINRRRPNSLVIEDDALFVQAGQRDGLVAFLADELARPRRRVTAEVLDQGFIALLRAYRAAADTLAGFEMAYERPSDTESLRRQLNAEFQRATR